MVTQFKPEFMNGRDDAREKAWMALGLYWEHNFGMSNPQVFLFEERVNWQNRLADDLQFYVDRLHSDAISSLGSLIQSTGTDEQIFVFNAQD